MRWVQALALLALAATAAGQQAREAFPQESHNPLQLYSVDAARTALQNGIVLTINSTLLAKSGEWFEVAWSGVEQPSYDDMVVLYVPANADVTKTAPAKYKWAARAEGHMRHGAGTTSFRLLNMRADMRFAFVRGGLARPLVAALSEVIRVARPNEPTGVHLALTGRSGKLVAQWTTRDAGSPIVRWGTAPGEYSNASGGRSQTYTRADLCGGVAAGAGWVEPGWLQAAVMGGLRPDTKYYYVVGDESFGFSDEFSFTSPPAVGRSASVEFFAIADMGQAEVDGANELSEMLPSLNTTALMAREAAGKTLLVHNGDISYALGYVTSWDAYFDQVQPLAGSMPYMVAIGNHERDWPFSGDRFNNSVTDSAGECGVPFERRLAMPTHAPDAPWYSYDYGPIHFLTYSTEHPFERGTPQYSFIERDLRAVQRSRTPWLVVNGHRPFYISSTWQHQPDGDQDVASALRDSLEQLFLDAGVDLTLHGHHHSYQRTCPMFRGQCVAEQPDGSAAAPVHIVIGHAGAGLCENVLPDPPPFFQVVKVEHGFMRVHANATHMRCQAVSDKDGALMDDFTLIKPPAAPGAVEAEACSSKLCAVA